MIKTKHLFISILFLILCHSIFAQKNIQMQKEGGVYTVPCSVNGIKMKFVFDTGASTVSISKTEADFLFKNGYLSKSDIIGKINLRDATGSISEGTIVNIKKIEFSGFILNDVKASVVNESNAPLLLGQSAMAKLGKFIFDPNKGVLTILDGNENYESNVDIKSQTEQLKEKAKNLAEVEDYDEAILILSRAIEINQNDFELYLMSGLLKYNMKDYYGSIKDLNKSIYLFPNFGYPFFLRANAKFSLNDYQGSINDFTKFIDSGLKLDSNTEKVYYWRGMSKIKLKLYFESINDFTKQILLNPNDSYSYFYRGVAQLNLRNRLKACEDFKKARELGVNEAYSREFENYCEF